MGMYGSAQVIYGFLLDEDDIEKIKKEVDFEEDVLYDWSTDNKLTYELGGNMNWDEDSYSHVVGKPIGYWLSEFGAHEIDEHFIEVPLDVVEQMKVWEKYFDRPAKRFLVTSYG